MILLQLQQALIKFYPVCRWDIQRERMPFWPDNGRLTKTAPGRRVDHRINLARSSRFILNCSSQNCLRKPDQVARLASNMLHYTAEEMTTLKHLVLQSFTNPDPATLDPAVSYPIRTFEVHDTQNFLCSCIFNAW